MLGSGHAQHQVVRDVGECVLERAGRFGSPNGEAIAGDALASDEALCWLLIETVSDPQMQIVFNTLEVVGAVAPVDCFEEDAEVVRVVTRGL